MRTVLALLLCLSPLAANSADGSRPFPKRTQGAEFAASVDIQLSEAAAAGKLAMLVLGANWCHDSRDFAAMLQEPELGKWLDEHYLVRMYNLGYLDELDTYLARFGVPVIYGTPTVLVVDPASGRLLNRELHYYWRNASQLDGGDARRYFVKYLATPVEPESPSANLAEALARIDQFEKEQATRIQAAYRVLSPLLKQYEAGEPAGDFEEKWVQLADMRAAITGDLAKLRDSARKQDVAGVAPVQLEFPSYPLFVD